MNTMMKRLHGAAGPALLVSLLAACAPLERVEQRLLLADPEVRVASGEPVRPTEQRPFPVDARGRAMALASDEAAGGADRPGLAASAPRVLKELPGR